MATTKEKTARLAAITKQVDEFVASGGNLRSPEAGALTSELAIALDDLGRDFGYELLKPNRKSADFIRPDPTSQH